MSYQNTQEVKMKVKTKNNLLARITTALGLAPTYAVDKVVDTTKSNYKAVIPKFLYKPPYL